MSETMSISAEDREKLAKSKFGEWFNEFFESKFEEAFQKKLDERGSSNQSQPQGQPQQQQLPGQPQQQVQVTGRRRSLLETCLSDTFGF